MDVFEGVIFLLSIRLLEREELPYIPHSVKGKNIQMRNAMKIFWGCYAIDHLHQELLKILVLWAGEMAQQLRALAAFAKNPGSVSSLHMVNS